MSKITFRADDDLIEELEAFDASKSEVMRDALRTYLDSRVREASSRTTSSDTHLGDGRVDEIDADTHRNTDHRTAGVAATSIDDLVRKRVDERLEERLARHEGQDVNVTIALEGVDEPDRSRVHRSATPARKTASDAARKTDREADPSESHGCGQCGESIDPSHVYCPNCGEKAAHRIFCECGDEVRSDWSFCPSCGRRTTAADVLDANSR